MPRLLVHGAHNAAGVREPFLVLAGLDLALDAVGGGTFPGWRRLALENEARQEFAAVREAGKYGRDARLLLATGLHSDLAFTFVLWRDKRTVGRENGSKMRMEVVKLSLSRYTIAFAETMAQGEQFPRKQYHTSFLSSAAVAIKAKTLIPYKHVEDEKKKEQDLHNYLLTNTVVLPAVSKQVGVSSMLPVSFSANVKGGSGGPLLAPPSVAPPPP